MKVQYTKLDPDFKAKWVAALRSGEYPQGRGYLEYDGCYCCLGVACKVINYNQNHSNTHIRDLADMPVVLRPISGTGGAAEKLTKMNDEKGKSFAQIADWIEKNL